MSTATASGPVIHFPTEEENRAMLAETLKRERRNRVMRRDACLVALPALERLAMVMQGRSGQPYKLREILFSLWNGKPASLVLITGLDWEIRQNLASLFLAQHKPADITPLVGSNVLFGAQLVEAMAAHGVTRLVNTGTSWQHFENSSYSPVNLYAATKQAFEAILHYYVETVRLRVISLKLFDTYGPADPRPKLFALLRNVAREQTPLAMSPGEQLIDLVYIDDAIDAFIVAGERLLAGKVNDQESYAVSSGRQVRLKDLVEIYGGIVGKKLPIAWGGRPYREREVMVPWNRGEALPGWHPRVALEEGIALMEGASTP